MQQIEAFTGPDYKSSEGTSSLQYFPKHLPLSSFAPTTGKHLSLSSAQMLIQMWYQHLRLFLQPLVWTHTGLKPHINNRETVCLVSPLIVWISCWAITQPRVFCRSKSRNSRLPSQPRNARGNDFLSPLIKSYL